MEDLSNCITRVTQELRILQEQLQWAAFQSSDSHIQNRVLDDLADIGLIHNLKNAVDHMRHFLWSYIDFATTNFSQPGEADHAMQSMRLEQITDMLRLLHNSSFPLYASSFVERITASVECLLEQCRPQEEQSKKAAA